MKEQGSRTGGVPQAAAPHDPLAFELWRISRSVGVYGHHILLPVNYSTALKTWCKLSETYRGNWRRVASHVEKLIENRTTDTLPAIQQANEKDASNP